MAISLSLPESAEEMFRNWYKTTDNIFLVLRDYADGGESLKEFNIGADIVARNVHIYRPSTS